jgi:ribosomal protein S18 acetylase RimI-like enzyme
MTYPTTTIEKAPRTRGIIRPLEPADRAPLLELLKGTGVFSGAELTIALELIDTVLQQPGQRDYLIRVYEEEGAVRGYYCVGPTPATEATYDLYWIAVDAPVHGGGIGTRLSVHAEELIRSCGGNLVIAETSSRAEYDQTRQFYRRRGYAELSRIRDYYRRGDDLVIFGKYLT